MSTATPRQAEVLALREQGLSTKQIAAQLGISVGTAKIHLSHLFEKGLATPRPKQTGWDGVRLDALVNRLESETEQYRAVDILAELKECRL